MKKITNYAEILEKVNNFLTEAEVHERPYQTDLYMHYDPKTQKAWIEEFANPGGNSWVKSSTIVGIICTDYQHCETWADYFYQSTKEVADVLEVTPEELEAEVRTSYSYDDDDSVGLYDVIRYCTKAKEAYGDKLFEAFEDAVRYDLRADIAQQAVDALDRFLTDHGFDYDD